MSRKLSFALAAVLIILLLSSCSSSTKPTESLIPPISTEPTIDTSIPIPSTKEEPTTQAPTEPPTTEPPTTVAPTTEEAYSEVGYWILSYVKKSGGDLDEKYIRDYESTVGYKAFVVFQDDHYGYLNLFGDEQEFTWRNGDAGGVKYTFTKDSLEMDFSDSILQFTRSNKKPPAKGTLVKPDPSKADITETVVLDEKGIKITAKSISYDASWYGPAIKLLIENNSGKNLTFQCRHASVNGFMVETAMSSDVANGKKANDILAIMSDSLELSGIEALAEIEFSFHVFDSDWNTYLDSAPVILKTNIAGTYEQKNDFSGLTIYDDKNIKVIALGLSEKDSFLGPSVRVYIENNTKKNIDIQTRDCSVNGFMIDTVFSSEICAGKKIVDSITLYQSDLDENDIQFSDIADVELSLHIFDDESWDTIVDTDPVVLNFK